MATPNQAIAAIIAQIGLAADGALVGIALAVVALRTLAKFRYNFSALRQIDNAPSLKVSDLRSLLDADPDSETLVVVRGAVDAKSAVEGGSWISLRPQLLVSLESGEKGVILQRNQTCIYNEWRGLLGWTSDLRSLFPTSWKEQESSSLRKVPFVLVDNLQRPQTEYVVVNMEGSSHQLPLTTVYQHLQPIAATPYTFIQALFGHDYPVGLLDEEKILHVGKEVSVVGVCSSKNGVVEVKSCKDLPFFMSELTKEEMVGDLVFKTNILFWGGTVIGSVSICIIGYAILRNWSRWRRWWDHGWRRWLHRDSGGGGGGNVQGPGLEDEDDDREEIGDGELCVVCLNRRRSTAFTPCGHRVCCRQCALSVELELAPKCPVCRQAIQGSFRIYDF